MVNIVAEAFPLLYLSELSQVILPTSRNDIPASMYPAGVRILRQSFPQDTSCERFGALSSSSPVPKIV